MCMIFESNFDTFHTQVHFIFKTYFLNDKVIFSKKQIFANKNFIRLDKIFGKINIRRS